MAPIAERVLLILGMFQVAKTHDPQILWVKGWYPPSSQVDSLVGFKTIFQEKTGPYHTDKDQSLAPGELYDLALTSFIEMNKALD